MYFRIQGMDCAEEMAALRRELAAAVGGAGRIAFDLLNQRMIVTPGREHLSPEEIIRAVNRTGLRAELVDGKLRPQRRRSRMPRWPSLLAVASGLLTLMGFLLHAWRLNSFVEPLVSGESGFGGSLPLAARLFYGLAIVAGTWCVLPKAWLATRRGRPDMNLLMTVAVLGAVAIGEWFEAATVSFLFSFSLVLESWSVDKARRAVGALVRLAPPTARTKDREGRETEVPADQVAAGMIFVVKPGERVPLDGTVVRGSTEVNQAPITGESFPVPKAAGDSVFAGTVNGSGAIEVECTKASGDTTLAQIIRLVSGAQSKRARAEQWVDRFAAIYTPAIMGLAVLVFLIPPLMLGGSWEDWFYRSLVLLVIGCPCALVISTPISMVAALAAAAHNGVLIKGGRHLEALARVNAVAFDKTGTLTRGRPGVVGVVPLSRHEEEEVLERAAAIETRSSHPLAEAIVGFARERGVSVSPADGFRMLEGRGATADVQGKQYWLGSHRYLEERGQESSEVHHTLEALSEAGRSVVVVGNDKHVCGLIAVSDAVRPEAGRAISGLRAAGVSHVAMLTGDHQGTADAVGRSTGVDDIRAELLPGDKVQAVESLVARYRTVAMVGDGVNDAPAMARATIGIAMAAAGSDAAIEVADVALMSDDLSKLPWLINHAKRSLRVVKQNIAFSLAVKTAFLVLTFAGWATLWGAIAADMGASLLVIFNGMSLLSASR